MTAAARNGRCAQRLIDLIRQRVEHAGLRLVGQPKRTTWGALQVAVLEPGSQQRCHVAFPPRLEFAPTVEAQIEILDQEIGKRLERRAANGDPPP